MTQHVRTYLFSQEPRSRHLQGVAFNFPTTSCIAFVRTYALEATKMSEVLCIPQPMQIRLDSQLK